VKMLERPVTVTCHVGPEQNLYHLSKVLTGLSELAEDGQIELGFTTVCEAACQTAEAALHLLITNEAATLNVVFDTFDRSDYFETTLLEHCDFYFKRSFRASDICLLPAAWQHKIVRFGLNYGCRSSRGEARLLEFQVQQSSLQHYLNAPAFGDFEQSPDTYVAPSIVFQTRAWAPNSTSDNVEEVNESRAGIIRALRKSFPGRFHGGFIRNPHALQRYPDLLSTYSSEQGEYVRLIKRCLVGISSRGLHHSVPFKVPENMAASLAIVSEPLRTELPVPYVPGTDFIEFRTPEECVDQCDHLLSNPSLVSSLREASWRYYESQVKPAQHVGNLLERALRLGKHRGMEVK